MQCFRINVFPNLREFTERLDCGISRKLVFTDLVGRNRQGIDRQAMFRTNAERRPACGKGAQIRESFEQIRNGGADVDDLLQIVEDQHGATSQ